MENVKMYQQRLSTLQSRKKWKLREINRALDTYRNTKCNKSSITGIQKEKKKQKEIENVYEEIMTGTSPSLMKNTNLYIQEKEMLTRIN